MRPRAAVNAPRQRFESVYSSEARARITELVDLDVEAVPLQPTVEAVIEACRGARVIFSTWGAQPYSRDLLDACPDLELILYAAGSFKAQVTDALLERAPTVCTAVHVNAVPTAEYSLMLILAALKDVGPFVHRVRREGPLGFAKDQFGFSGGYYRTTVALLGFGLVSRHLAGLLRPFNIHVLMVDDYLGEAEAVQLGVTKARLDEAISCADVVSIHHADVERNWGIINRRTLALMKPGARLVNTSRGRMIDETALVEALEAGRISAYLDVTHPEPPREGHPFYTLPNVVLTPHIAGSLGPEVHQMGDYCVRELEHWLAGEPFEHTVDIADLADRA